MLKKIQKSLISFLLLWIAANHGKLAADDLIESATFVDSQASSSGLAFEPLSFLQDRVSAQVSTRYIQDSNVFLRNNETEASILNGSVLLGVEGGGLPDESGLSYKLLYGGNYFSSMTDDFEYESPADHSFLSGFELRGAFTKLSLNANIEEQGGYSRSEPFTDGISSTFGEARNLGFQRKRLAFGISRELASSELALKLSLDRTNYNVSNLIAQSYENVKFATDLSWFYDPVFLAKTRLGIGLKVGQEEITQSVLGSQTFMIPSLRGQWNYSSKTAFTGSIGFDERWRDADDFSETTPVYGLEGLWTAPTDTQFTISITKQVYSSIYEIDNNVATKKFSVGASQAFDGGIMLGLRYFYEFSGYKPTLNAGALRSRVEDLQSLRLSLGKSLNLGSFDDAQVSIFYNQLVNESTKDSYDFERNQYGIQLKFSL
ncbi:MAG: hypothetical protein ACJ0K4_06535 [Verrucomicrobiales bacterium]